MTFDDILNVVGRFGRWHKFTLIFFIPIFVLVAYHMVGSVFYQAEPEFRCRLPSEGASAKFKMSKEDMAKSYPNNSETNAYDRCAMYENGTGSKKISCENYVFDDSYYGETATTLFGMVCAYEYMSSNGHTIYMGGYLIGSFISGWLSDRFGRKKILCICLIIQTAFGVMIFLSLNYIMFMIGRFGDGIASAAVNVVAYCLVTELVVPQHRLYAGQMAQLSFACGYMIIGLHGYLIRNWRLLFGVMCAPGFLFLGYWFIIPESPRWLMTTKRDEAAQKIIKNIAKWNKVDLAQHESQINDMMKQSVNTIIPDTPESPAAKATILDIFRYKRLRRNSLLLFCSWFSIAMTYFGITFGSNLLYGDDFVNFGIAGITEIFAYVTVLFTVNRWGRKNLYCISMIVAGVFLICYGFIPEGFEWLATTIAMIGKCFVCFAYAVAYIYTVELYPTVIRNAGLGTCSTLARIGTMIAPQLTLLRVYWRPAPMIIMGVAVLVCGILSLSLPETLHKTLPETIEEGENFGRAPAT